jgi:hypothetical protein
MVLEDAIKLLLSLKLIGDDLLNDLIFVLVHGNVGIGGVWSWLRKKPLSHVFVVEEKHVVLLV